MEGPSLFPHPGQPRREGTPAAGSPQGTHHKRFPHSPQSCVDTQQRHLNCCRTWLLEEIKTPSGDWWHKGRSRAVAHLCCGMNQWAHAQAVCSGPTAGGSQLSSPTLSRDAKADKRPGFTGNGRPAIAGWPDGGCGLGTLQGTCWKGESSCLVRG